MWTRELSNHVDDGNRNFTNSHIIKKNNEVDFSSRSNNGVDNRTSFDDTLA